MSKHDSSRRNEIEIKVFVVRTGAFSCRLLMLHVAYAACSADGRRPRRKEGFARWDGDVRRGRVNETKPAADEFSEADAVAKGGDDRRLGKGRGDVGDPEIRTEEPDEARDHESLSS